MTYDSDFIDDDFSDDDLGDDSESEALPCPSCHQLVYEDTEQCPHCGDWITPLAAHARKPVWIRVAGFVALAAFLTLALAGAWRACI